MRTKILGMLVVVVVVLLATGISLWRFGSAANTVAYLNGDYIQVDRDVAALGAVSPGKEMKVTFDLSNLSSRPIRLVGANCSCSCVLPPKVPMELAGAETTPVEFNFQTPDSEMEFEEIIELYFDGSLRPMRLSITGVTK